MSEKVRKNHNRYYLMIVDEDSLTLKIKTFDDPTNAAEALAEALADNGDARCFEGRLREVKPVVKIVWETV